MRTTPRAFHLAVALLALLFAPAASGEPLGGSVAPDRLGECGGRAPGTSTCGFQVVVEGDGVPFQFPHSGAIPWAAGDPEFWGSVQVLARNAHHPNLDAYVRCEILGRVSVCEHNVVWAWPIVAGRVDVLAVAEGEGDWVAFLDAFPPTP